MKNVWHLKDAKYKFSEIFDRTLIQGSQFVTRHGKKEIVIVPVEEYEELTHRNGSLSDFLLSSPLKNSELPIKRNKELP
jgi:prevent-host-death family protein